MKKIKFIYFDIGGVLIDYQNAFRGATSKFNIPFQEFMDIWRENNEAVTRGNIRPQEFWTIATKKLKIDNAEAFDFLTSWVEDYKPIKTTHAIVNKFIKKYQIGLLSNLYKGMIPMLLERKLIPNVNYSQIITSAESGLKKPDRDIYELATKKAGVNHHEILFVDDRDDFIAGAKAVGWNTFLFNSDQNRDSIKELTAILDRSE